MTLQFNKMGSMVAGMFTQLEGLDSVGLREMDWITSNNYDVSAKDMISPDDYFFIVVGSKVSLKRANLGLFDKPLITTAFMSVTIELIRGINQLAFVMPHPGVLNYIGEVKWVLNSYGIASILISKVSSHFYSLIQAGKDVDVQTEWDIISSQPETTKLVTKLQGYGNRLFWDGVMASKLDRYLAKNLEPNAMTPSQNN